MAKKSGTVFQALDKAITGNWNPQDTVTPHINTYDMSNMGDDVIYRTHDKEEYLSKKLELQQNKYLKDRWIKANVNLSVTAYAGLNNVKLMYRDADLMDAFPEIGAALDIISEESCLHEKTKIKLLNGEIKTIKELYDSNYKNFWVYSVDSNGKCKPSKIDRVAVNGKKLIYEIGLDDGSIIKCTNNHQWLLSNNEWKRTDELIEGESLMSIYDKLDYKGYEKIKSTSENKFTHTHRIVAENLLHDEKEKLSEINHPFQKIVIHHKSFDKLNNDPNELVYMFWNDHQKLHTDLNSDRWNNDVFANKMKKIFSETNRRLWKESSRKDLREKLSKAQQKRIAKFSDSERVEYFGRKGEKNGMYGVHRFGELNPNYDINKNHIKDIDINEYVNYIINCDKFPTRKKLCENFNLTKNDVIILNKKICEKYSIKNASSIVYLLKPNFRISDIKKCIIDNPKLLQNQIAKKLGIAYYNISKAIEIGGYNSFEELKEHATNHIVRYIKKTNEISTVYDLVNSSCNNCFAVKCNEGHIISHNCITNDKGMIVNVYSKSDRIKSILEDLFVNRLNIQLTGQMIIRAMCKYGNQFMLLDVDNKNGVKGWKQMPVFNMERIENGIQNPYGAGASIAVNGITKDNADMSTQFIWLDDNNSQIPFRDWQIAHFRLLTNSLYLPYGVSYLNAARRHWRMLSLMEDMMLIYRLERSIERRVYKIFVGAIDDADVQAYVERIANEFKRTPIVDPMTGQIDLRKNILSVDQDIFIPVRDENAPTPIDTLSAAQNMTALDDIKFVQNKVLTALRIPKSFLNFEEAAGEGKNLALMDIRFTRTVNRIQQAFLMELTKVASIHLFLLGFNDELNNFTLSMNNPSTQAEGLEIENMQKKIDAVRDAVSDPGNGLPVMSQTRALKQIMKWSEKEIKENLEEIRLEKGIAAELEKTTQIIKKTGIFDTVDRIYGEPGAEYMDDQQGQGGMGDDGGMGGGGAAPPPPMGGEGDMGGDLNGLGAPGDDGSGGDIAGAEGSMPTADMGTDPNAPMEAVNRNKPLINEQKNVFDEYMKMLNEHSLKPQEAAYKRADVYDSESLLINEEFDKMIKALNKFVVND